MKIIPIKKAIEQLNIMSLNNDERKIYENELKILRDHKAELKASEEKGIDTGENRRAIKLAENFLRMGLIKSI